MKHRASSIYKMDAFDRHKGQTDRQTDRQTNKQTNKRTDLSLCKYVSMFVCVLN